ncbi:hypothetical protein JF544_16435 [Halobacillus kuroshimensis]|uniref:Uncharacterized protein n=1 Tax=Halobacillus kuroshimensis TaxID=302481 RepID=A0ABS3DZS3_9BACI|nr:hypothetical protein [Halobacillus kuroshimensis]MBN8236847.1 hypothetical protein [Halobacillus kuroshimensis]
MQTFFSFLNQGWIGVLIGLIGIVIGIYSHRKATMGARLNYNIKSSEIIGANNDVSDEIEIYYRGVSVPRVIKSYIVLWNSGNKTVDKKEVVPGDPLKILFQQESKIMNYNILKQTNPVNNVQLNNNKTNGNEIDIDFEYLDPKDGFLVEVLHTDDEVYPSVVGSVKGMTQGINYVGPKKSKNSAFFISFKRAVDKTINSGAFFKITLAVGILANVIGILIGVGVEGYVLESFKKEFGEGTDPTIISLVMIVAGSPYIIMSLTAFRVMGKRFPKELDPE